MFKDPNPSKYKCECRTCKDTRRKLKSLSKEKDTSLSYHLVKILKELLGEGNY